MTLQVTAVGKTLAADGALAGKLVTAVSLHVPAETTITQCFVAHHASLGHFTLAAFFVLYILGRCEGFPTPTTLLFQTFKPGRSIRAVIAKMKVDRRGGPEHLVTQLTANRRYI